MRNTTWDLVWLIVVCLLALVRPLVLGALNGTLEVVGTLTLSAVLWLITPYLLLARRLPWLHLLPIAVLSAIGMTGVGIWSAIYMPHAITASASQFGVIGIGFALLTWLFVSACVLVVAATGGAMITDRLTHRRRVPAAAA